MSWPEDGPAVEHDVASARMREEIREMLRREDRSAR